MSCMGRLRARAADSLRPLVIATGLLTFLSLGRCVPAPEPDPSAELIHTEILTFLDAWNTAIAAGDRDAVRAAYVADPRFRWFEDGALRYRSVDEVLGGMDALGPGTEIRTELTNVETEPLSHRLAHGSASFETRLTMPQGAFSFGGVFTMLLERDDDGWRFVTGHTSTHPTDPAGAAPAADR